MQLYNKLSADERSKILESTNLKRITLSFYQYAKITDPKKFRDSLFIFWDSIGVLGRIYVANEGINAQLSLPEENIKKFTKHLNSISFLKNIRLNIALKHEIKSFLKLKIKVKNKILEALNMDSKIGSVQIGKLADFVIVEENPLQNLKVLYGTGAIKLNDKNEVIRVGGVKYTIKDGIIYDAKRLLKEVKEMVDAKKVEENWKLSQPGIN